MTAGKTASNSGVLVDKYDTLRRVRLFLSCSAEIQIPESEVYVGIICQAISDAMGLYGADREKVYISHTGNARGKRKFITQQEEALNWFRNEEHYPYCDVVGMDRERVDMMFKQCGVEL